MKCKAIKVALAAFLISTAAVTAPIYAQAASEPSVVSVSGYAEQEVAPDTAYITIGMITTNDDAQKARQENNLVMNQVTNAVKTMGVTSSDLKTTGFNLSPNYDNKGQKIVSYTVSNNLSIRVSDFDMIPRIIEKAGQAGANRVTGIRFTTEHADQIKQNLIKQAVYNGRQAAAAAAEAAGSQLGKVKEINISYSSPSYERVYAAPANMKLARADADYTPVEAGTNKLSETVNMTFYIQ